VSETARVSDLVIEATLILREAGVDQPRREARLMLQELLGWSATEFIRGEDNEISADHAASFEGMVRMRARRTPLAHVTGSVRFFGLDLLSDRRALVPRSDSEVVVEAALERLPRGQRSEIVDLGTGSGCLLLAILSKAPLARGTGVDVSAVALDLAAENAERAGLSARANLLKGHWAGADLSGADLVVSNPPYIRTEEIDLLEPEVRDHDPRIALDGGVDGLEAYRQIAPLVRQQARPGTWLVLEVGHDQGEAVSDLLVGLGFQLVETIRDYGGRTRVVTGCQPD
jgi:release factor glutamine methyltransferase